MPDLRIAEWLIILATIAGPILAVQSQKLIERLRESRQRRLRLFYELMATRAARVSPSHVQALNMIDIEFYGPRIFGMRFQRLNEKKIIESWRIYHDHLNEQANPKTIEAWIKRGDELFIDLLYNIAIGLGYDFDKVQLKRGVYYPRAHDENEVAQLTIRDNLVKILTGKAALPMAVTYFPTHEEALRGQLEVQAALLNVLRGDGTLNVRVEEDRNS